MYHQQNTSEEGCTLFILVLNHLNFTYTVAAVSYTSTLISVKD